MGGDQDQATAFLEVQAVPGGPAQGLFHRGCGGAATGIDLGEAVDGPHRVRGGGRRETGQRKSRVAEAVAAGFRRDDGRNEGGGHEDHRWRGEEDFWSWVRVLKGAGAQPRHIAHGCNNWVSEAGVGPYVHGLSSSRLSALLNTAYANVRSGMVERPCCELDSCCAYRRPVVDIVA